MRRAPALNISLSRVPERQGAPRSLLHLAFVRQLSGEDVTARLDAVVARRQISAAASLRGGTGPGCERPGIGGMQEPDLRSACRAAELPVAAAGV